MKTILAVVFLFVASVGAWADENQTKAPAVGQEPPAIQLQKVLQAPDGTQLSWETLKGKVVVLEFWATWCGPCVGSIVHMNELETAFADRPVQFIAITDEDEATIADFLTKKPILGWVGLNTDRAMFKSFAVGGIPETVIVGADGKIAAITYPMMLEAKNLENVLAGKDSGLPDTVPDEDHPRVPVGEIPGNDKKEIQPVFQVVIRPAQGSGFGGSGAGKSGKSELGDIYGETLLGLTVEQMLPRAYKVGPMYLAIESPLPAGNYDVFLKVPYKNKAQLNSLLREAVEGTFGLSSKHESRELDCYVLTVAKKDAPGLRPTTTPKTSSVMGGIGKISGVNVKLSSLTRTLENVLNKPIVNETELKDGYDVDLKWNQTMLKPSEPSDVIDAVENQLGLKLTPERKQMDVVVVRREAGG